MPLEVKKKERENPQSLVRRFSKRIKQSGLLIRVRKKQYRRRAKSPQLKKKAALRREEKKESYEKKKKMGN